MGNKLNFTKAALDRLQPGLKQESYQDTTVRGLILLVYPTGGKTFFIYRRIAGRPERIKLGAFPQMTVEQARKQAELVNGTIADRQNPAAVRRAVKVEPTFGEVLSEFIKKKRSRSGKPLSSRTIEDYEALLVNHLASISKLKLSQITPDRIRSLKIESDAQNNRARAVISSVFNWAQGEGITNVDSPAYAIKTRLIKSRERFLQPSELPRFMTAVQSSRLADFFLLALFTGARKTNLQEMRWQDLNMEEAVWRIPKTKNGDAQLVPLIPDAIKLLKAREVEKVVDAIWVFPGPGKTGHLVAPRKAWMEILEKAGLDEHLRIHDLRRTLGSWQARAGASLTVIGKSLGHRSLQATAIYSRLDIDPVRASVEQAATAMVEASRKRST
jgi:integrase